MNTNLNGFNYMLCSIHIIRIFLKFLTSTIWFPVISYPSHSVPFSSFRTHVRFIMVIRTQFGHFYQFGQLVHVPTFVFIYNHFSHFLHSFLHFLAEAISYPGSFRA